MTGTWWQGSLGNRYQTEEGNEYWYLPPGGELLYYQRINSLTFSIQRSGFDPDSLDEDMNFERCDDPRHEG